MRKPAGMVVALALATGGLFGLGEAVHLGRTDAASAVTLDTWQGNGPSTGLSVREDADRLFDSFSGTVPQRDAAAVVQAYEGNRAMDECMADAGHPEWDWSLPRVGADPDDPLSTNVWLARPMSRWRSHDVVAAKPFSRAETTMNAPETADYSQSVSRCLARVQMAPSKDVSGDSAPPDIERLQESWWGLVARFESSQLPGYAVYEGCMKGADITMMRGVASDDGYETAIGYAMSGASPPDNDVPSDPGDTHQWSNPAWQRFLGLEDEFDRADWNCRKDVYAAHIADLGPVIDSFAAGHATEIARASRYWHDMSTKAAAMGYTGQVGSLEGIVAES